MNSLVDYLCNLLWCRDVHNHFQVSLDDRSESTASRCVKEYLKALVSIYEVHDNFYLN